MTTLEQLNLSQPLTDVYTAMETDLMMAIARQLARDGEISATSEWRIKKLAEAGALSKETVKIIASYTGIQSDLLTETIEASAYSIIDRLEPALQQVARDGLIGSVEHKAVSESTAKVVANFRAQAKTDLNLVNTVMQYKAKAAYTKLVNKIYDEANRQELLSTLGKHSLATAAGAVSRQEAVRNCIKEFSQKGIPAFVDKAGREWSPEAYINMDIRTTVNNTAHAAQDACCDKYDIDLFQISSHNGARPKCARDQGKLVSRSNRSGIAHDGNGNPIPFIPLSQTSYGQPDGIFGVNCHHKKYPFIDGINFQRYFPYDEEENAERYKELQKQRYLERRVRETSRQVDMLKETGDIEGAKEARRKLTAQRKAYREYSDSHGLAQHNDRLTVTRVRKGDNVFADIHAKPLDNGGGSGIISTKGQGSFSAEYSPSDKSNFVDDVKELVGIVKGKIKSVKYADLPDDFKTSFDTRLEKSEPNVRKLLEKWLHDADIHITDSKNSFYQKELDYIEINIGKPPATLSHELFHRIDFKNDITKNSIFEKSLKKDFQALNEASGGDVVQHLIHKFPKSFTTDSMGNVRLKEEFYCISDIISGITHDDINLGFHHKKAYWEQNTRRVASEAWANYGRIYYENNAEVIAMLEELFPTFAYNTTRKVVKLANVER